jgi:hypothetical protein
LLARYVTPTEIGRRRPPHHRVLAHHRPAHHRRHRRPGRRGATLTTETDHSQLMHWLRPMRGADRGPDPRRRVHGRGAVSHAYALGHIDPADRARIVDWLAEVGVTIVTAAVYAFPVPPIKQLLAAGVKVACGNDCIRDLWGPHGSGDMLDRAMHLAYRSTFRRDEDIELALRATSGFRHTPGGGPAQPASNRVNRPAPAAVR